MPHIRFGARPAAETAIKNPSAVGPDMGKSWPAIEPPRALRTPMAAGPDMGIRLPVVVVGPDMGKSWPVS